MSSRVLTAGLLAAFIPPRGGWAAQREALVPESALREAGLTQYWQTELPLQHGDAAVSAYLYEDSLYVTTHLGEVHALDPNVGLVRWARSVAERGRRVFKPFQMLTADGRAAVVVAHAAGAYVYDRNTGAQLAEVPELWPAGSAAVADAVSLYVGSSDGYLHAVRWSDPVYGTAIRTWKVLGGGPVTATPLLLDNVLYFASQGGGVFACTADWNKNLHWRYSTEAAVVADLYGDESGVYVASLDRSLYRLDLATGAVLWRHRFPLPLRDAPVVSQRTVYQYCRGAGLYAIDVDTHELLWTEPSATAFVSRRADRTCVLLGDDRLALLDSTSGKVRKALPIPDRCLVAANPEALTIYLITPDGAVSCFTSSEVRHLRAKDILEGVSPLEETEAPGTGKGDSDTEKAVSPASDVNLDDPLRSRSDR
ncbi:MAG: PQQ-binding-like beta-propeller repeat protein [Planctomycetota bacterium]